MKTSDVADPPFPVNGSATDAAPGIARSDAGAAFDWHPVRANGARATPPVAAGPTLRGALREIRGGLLESLLHGESDAVRNARLAKLVGHYRAVLPDAHDLVYRLDALLAEFGMQAWSIEHAADCSSLRARPAGGRRRNAGQRGGHPSRRTGMGTCAVCGNRYDKTFTIRMGDVETEFDSFECAIHRLAPDCAHCGCRILGHGIESEGTMYCCASCARQAGVDEARDRVD